MRDEFYRNYRCYDHLFKIYSSLKASTSVKGQEFRQESHKIKGHQYAWQPEDSLPDQDTGRVGAGWGEGGALKPRQEFGPETKRRRKLT